MSFENAFESARIRDFQAESARIKQDADRVIAKAHEEHPDVIRIKKVKELGVQAAQKLHEEKIKGIPIIQVNSHEKIIKHWLFEPNYHTYEVTGWVWQLNLNALDPVKGLDVTPCYLDGKGNLLRGSIEDLEWLRGDRRHSPPSVFPVGKKKFSGAATTEKIGVSGLRDLFGGYTPQLTGDNPHNPLISADHGQRESYDMWSGPLVDALASGVWEAIVKQYPHRKV
jgi:hypothetical protein